MASRQSSGGVLICGREYYFNSDHEMITMLGIDKSKAIIIKCNTEFDETEFDYFLENSKVTIIPKWLPRRPLVVSMLSRLTLEECAQLLEIETSEVDFAKKFIEIICEREEKMFQVFEKSTILKILIAIARTTRSKANNVGPISPSEIKAAFESVLGQYPIESASTLLQRLVGLGRYESESENRIFADTYILDILRALDVSEILKTQSDINLNDDWLNPLKPLGLSVVSSKIESKKHIVQILKRNHTFENRILLSDIACSLFMHDINHDFEELTLTGAHISLLDCSKQTPLNLYINNSIIEILSCGALESRNFIIKNSIISKVCNILTPQKLPVWIIESEIGEYFNIVKKKDIIGSDLSLNHKAFLIMIRKIFFQAGTARKEEALLRGIGTLIKPNVTKKILNILISEKIISTGIGDQGTLYKPNRKYMSRMELIENKREFSKDPLWEKIGKL